MLEHSSANTVIQFFYSYNISAHIWQSVLTIHATPPHVQASRSQSLWSCALPVLAPQGLICQTTQNTESLFQGNEMSQFVLIVILYTDMENLTWQTVDCIFHIIFFVSNDFYFALFVLTLNKWLPHYFNQPWWEVFKLRT